MNTHCCDTCHIWPSVNICQECPCHQPVSPAKEECACGHGPKLCGSYCGIADACWELCRSCKEQLQKEQTSPQEYRKDCIRCNASPYVEHEHGESFSHEKPEPHTQEDCGYKDHIFSWKGNNYFCNICASEFVDYERKFKFVWTGLNQRCNRPKAKNYIHYGGRGIKCEWKSYEDFKNDMLDAYILHIEKHGYASLDRINNDGNYSKENCRWATHAEQIGNTRRTIHITIDGVTHNQKEWCEIFGIQKSVFTNRVRKGMTPEEALKTPPMRNRRKGLQRIRDLKPNNQ